jgi:hypothetical protein
MMQTLHTLSAKSPQSENLFVDYIAEDNLFLIYSAEYDSENNNVDKFLQEIRNEFISNMPISLQNLEIVLSEIIQKHNLPTRFSLALGLKKNNGLYLKVYGEGRIYIIRNNNCLEIVHDGQSASGKILENDIFIFTNSVLENPKQFIKLSPIEIINVFNPLLQEMSHKGKIALVCDFKEGVLMQTEETEVMESVINNPKPWKKILESIKQIFEKSKESVGNTTNGKKTTFIIVCILLVIFIWSVGLGYVRRGEANTNKRIADTKELITQKLYTVDEVAYLNLPRAMILIQESRQVIAKLIKEIGNKKGIDELEKIVNQKENTISKKEDKTFNEFYDLTVDIKKAKGDLMSINGDTAAIVDKTQGIVYVLSMSKKSLEKRTTTEIKNCQLVSIYQDRVFIVSNNSGIYEIGIEGKAKKIIDQDKDWGEIGGIAMFNSNIYLLDKVKDEVYKYLGSENGFSTKSSYFQSGEAIKLSSANSLAIDSSVYIGMENNVFKYTAGVKDEFKTSFPDNTTKIYKVFTSKDLEKVYVWSKDKGVIYILAKNGEYEKTVSSSIMSQSSDFFAYKEMAYFLKGPKIYSVDLH